MINRLPSDGPSHIVCSDCDMLMNNLDPTSASSPPRLRLRPADYFPKSGEAGTTTPGLKH